MDIRVARAIPTRGQQSALSVATAAACHLSPSTSEPVDSASWRTSWEASCY